MIRRAINSDVVMNESVETPFQSTTGSRNINERGSNYKHGTISEVVGGLTSTRPYLDRHRCTDQKAKPTFFVSDRGQVENGSNVTYTRPKGYD